eukprot:3742381-Prymnesium_polylepis.1
MPRQQPASELKYWAKPQQCTLPHGVFVRQPLLRLTACTHDAQKIPSAQKSCVAVRVERCRKGGKVAHLRRKCVRARPANRATLTPATTCGKGTDLHREC